MNSSVEISSLFIYPVKSLRGIALDEAKIEDRGFRFDRRWMLVDNHGVFMTQREYPRMSLLSVEIEAETLCVRGPGMPQLAVPLYPISGAAQSVVVWNDTVRALVVDGAGPWFSEFLGAQCSLVYMPDDADRPVDPTRAPQGSIVGFADAFPFLLISEASLEDLNAGLEMSLPMTRFRPNIVVRGCGAFAEDGWRKIQAGEVSFSVVKPCARCTITTVDHETGLKGVEPLRTLSSYRQRDGHVWFGQNLVHGGKGVLRLGEVVRIVE